jgi:hypothetical protein
MLTHNDHEEIRPSYFSFSSSGDLAKQVPFMQKLNSISQSVLLNRKKKHFCRKYKIIKHSNQIQTLKYYLLHPDVQMLVSHCSSGFVKAKVKHLGFQVRKYNLH